MYHDASGNCQYCPHLWQGGRFGGPPGPIYNHDTRYFWRPESIRDSAQLWEYGGHHETDPAYAWRGHCDGITCASIMEPDVLPQDCGALGQDDLEGLLAEIYGDCDLHYWTDLNAKPGDVWFYLREWLKVQPVHAPRVLAVDFDTANVHFLCGLGYRIDGDVVDDTLFRGIMTLYYEKHTHGALYDPDSAWYEFECKCLGSGVGFGPKTGTGAWCGSRYGPERYDGQRFDCPPDQVCTAESLPHTKGTRNWFVCDSTLAALDTLKRVIEHKTIILDDAYADSWYIDPPPDNHPRVRRPGFADSCWASDDVTRNKYTAIMWYPRLACTGSWSFYVYKTPPVDGDTLDPFADVGWDIPEIGNRKYWPYSQAVPPFDTWQFLGSHSLVQESVWIFVSRWDDLGRYHFTYFDAVRLELNEGGLEGGASAATIALGDASQFIRVTPNPVRRVARISYALSTLGSAEIVVYDVTGRAVQRASQFSTRAGPQNVTIPLDGLAAGAYIVRVNACGERQTCRFVVCR